MGGIVSSHDGNMPIKRTVNVKEEGKERKGPPKDKNGGSRRSGPVKSKARGGI